MNDRVGEALTVGGFVALLLAWFGAATVLTVLPLEALPDPIGALVVSAWLLPFLLLGAYSRLRSSGDGGSGTATP